MKQTLFCTQIIEIHSRLAKFWYNAKCIKDFHQSRKASNKSLYMLKTAWYSRDQRKFLILTFQQQDSSLGYSCRFSSDNTSRNLRYCHRSINQHCIHTSMHSSRMRTARMLTISQHALRRGVYPRMHWAGGVYPSMHWQGGCLPGEVSAQGGVCQRGCLPGGVCLRGWQTPPPVNGMTDRQV